MAGLNPKTFPKNFARPTAANPTIIVGTGKNSSLKSCEKRKTLDFKQKAVDRMVLPNQAGLPMSF
jgi:hypothetical protein